MTTKTKVCLQNPLKIFDSTFSCLTPRVNVCIHLELQGEMNLILFPNAMTSVFSLFN